MSIVLMDEQEAIDRAAMEQEFRVESATGGLTLFEQLLWKLALKAPKGMRIIWGRNERDPYLLRVYLYRGKRYPKYIPHVYLHRFFRGDLDREVHNHPWQRAWSLVLTKGYREFRWNELKQMMEEFNVRPWTINRLHRDDFHRVELVRGRSWTLFFTLDRMQASNGEDWGFLDVLTGDYTPWGKFVYPVMVDA